MNYSPNRYLFSYWYFRYSLVSTLSCFLFLIGAQAQTPNVHKKTVASESPNDTQKVTETFVSDVIPKSSPYVFGYEPRWDESGSTKKQEPIDIITSLWRIAESNADRLSSAWNEEERSAWEMIRSLPFPKSQSDLKQMGFDGGGAMWVYGLGLTPAFVVEVSSPDRLRAWSIEHLSGLQHGFEQRSHPLGSYWRRALKRWTVLIKLKGNRLMLTILPRESEPVLLSYFLRERQAESASDEIRSRFKELPAGVRGSGFISLQRLIDLIFGSEHPLLKFSAAGFGLPSQLISACETDLRAIGDSITTLTFGLSEREDDLLKIFTHFSLSPEQLKPWSQTSRKTSELEPLSDLSMLSDEQFGTIASRAQFGAVFSAISVLSERWSAHPWSCGPLLSLNGLAAWDANPQYTLAKSLLSPISGLTVKLREEENNTPTLGTKDNKRFGVWLELAHQSPQLLLKLFSSISGSPPLQSTHYLLDHKVKQLKSSNPKLTQLFYSLDPQRLMMSIGDWGLGLHESVRRAEREKQPSNSKEKRSHNETQGRKTQGRGLSEPLLLVALPPSFSEWLNGTLASLKSDRSSPQNQGKSSVLNVDDVKRKESIFRLFSLHAQERGLTLQVILDLKSL